jgi:hypothetical protein
MAIPLLLICIAMQTSLCILLISVIREARAERRAIEANISKMVRQHPELFRESKWDRYRYQ